MKSLTSVILASTNQGKIKEINEIISSLAKKPLEIQAPLESLEVEETGETFLQNSYLKAKAYYDKFQTPVLADDSGLIINSKPDILGVKSARFRPDVKDYSKKCELLIEELSDTKNRSAYFVSILCLYISNEEKYFFEGRLNGNIDDKLSGSDGFGYDPIFLPSDHPTGLSLASDATWKNENSHRRKAVNKLIDFLQYRD